MGHVIHIFGASGSGTSTLGRKICEKTGFRFMDTDDYYWMDTDPKYTQKRPPEERVALMLADMGKAENVVISGSLCKWGDALVPYFTLAVRVETDTAVRIARLKKREWEHFGSRIHEGGDMYRLHTEFIEWASGYDDGDVTMRSKAMHDEWQKKLACPLLCVNGAEELEVLFSQVVMRLTLEENGKFPPAENNR